MVVIPSQDPPATLAMESPCAANGPARVFKMLSLIVLENIVPEVVLLSTALGVTRWIASVRDMENWTAGPAGTTRLEEHLGSSHPCLPRISILARQ